MANKRQKHERKWHRRQQKLASGDKFPKHEAAKPTWLNGILIP